MVGFQITPTGQEIYIRLKLEIEVSLWRSLLYKPVLYNHVMDIKLKLETQTFILSRKLPVRSILTKVLGR